MEFSHKIYPVNQWVEVENRLNGSNHKGVLFVYNIDDEDHLDFLRKILSAVEMDFKEVVSLSVKSNEYLKLPQTIENKNIDKIIVFGIHPKNLCLNTVFSKYNISHIRDYDVLFADKLLEIQESKELKKNLWICLKDLFEV